MKLYATRTGTRRNNAVLDELGFARVVSHIAAPSADDLAREYAIDNGAWTAHQQGTSWNEQEWQRFVWQHGSRATFVVVPDIVMGGADSLRRSLSWLPWLYGLPVQVRLLLAVQNGMTTSQLRPYVGGRVGLFVGGDSEWKERTIPMWAELGHEARCHVHVGRVNTRRRLLLCQMSGVDSCDGTGSSIYAIHAKRMGAWVRQGSLLIA